MGDHYTCGECGERVDPKGTPHYCPGTPGERMDALETEVKRLKRLVAVLLTGRTLPPDDLQAFLDEVDD